MFGRKRKAVAAAPQGEPADEPAEAARPAPSVDNVALAERLDAEGRHEDAVDALRRGWTSGSVEAARLLGERLLLGRDVTPFPQEGAALIGSAAERGDAEAHRIMANLAGAGACMTQSWSTALDHLAEAAILGSDHARAQLRLLSGLQGRDWRIMRERVDIDAWLTPPPRTAICEDPRIRVASGVCPPPVCDWLVEAARHKLKPAMMYDNALRRPVPRDSRRCSQHQFDIVDSDVVLLLVRGRIAALTKLPTYAMEPPQVFHYKVGEEIKAHFDHVKGGDEGFGRGGGFTSERLVSSITYLNDDYDGGELEFLRTTPPVKHKGRKGDIIYFTNLIDDRTPDPKSLHAGLPVTRGEKWVLSQWVHNQPFNAVV